MLKKKCNVQGNLWSLINVTIFFSCFPLLSCCQKLISPLTSSPPKCLISLSWMTHDNLAMSPLFSSFFIRWWEIKYINILMRQPIISYFFLETQHLDSWEVVVIFGLYESPWDEELSIMIQENVATIFRFFLHLF